MPNLLNQDPQPFALVTASLIHGADSVVLPVQQGALYTTRTATLGDVVSTRYEAHLIPSHWLRLPKQRKVLKEALERIEEMT